MSWTFRPRLETVFDPIWLKDDNARGSAPKRPIVSCAIEPVDVPTAGTSNSETPPLRGAEATVLAAVQAAVEEEGGLIPGDEASPEMIGVSRRTPKILPLASVSAWTPAARPRVAMINRALAGLAAKALLGIRDNWISIRRDEV